MGCIYSTSAAGTAATAGQKAEVSRPHESVQRSKDSVSTSLFHEDIHGLVRGPSGASPARQYSLRQHPSKSSLRHQASSLLSRDENGEPVQRTRTKVQFGGVDETDQTHEAKPVHDHPGHALSMRKIAEEVNHKMMEDPALEPVWESLKDQQKALMLMMFGGKDLLEDDQGGSAGIQTMQKQLSPAQWGAVVTHLIEAVRAVDLPDEVKERAIADLAAMSTSNGAACH